MYTCESQSKEKAKPQRTDAFKLWCWRRHLRVPWTASRANQSILKDINREYSLEALITEADAPILWPPDAKSWLTGKDPDSGKDWGQKEKWATEDEMDREHHQLNGHEFDLTWGDSRGQGSLACYSPWVCKELDITATEQQLLSTSYCYFCN